MKYINDLAYANLITQAKYLTKDKKQKNKYRQTVLLDMDQDSGDEPEELLITLNVNEEDERRDGADRRVGQEERGRYIESRLNKNRRYKRKLSLKI